MSEAAAIEAIIHDWTCGCGKGQACPDRDGCREAAEQILETRQSLPDHSAAPDLMANLLESLSRPTWVIHLWAQDGPLRRHRETWVGQAESREAADAAALDWAPNGFFVSYADGPFVKQRDHDRLRAENELLRENLRAVLLCGSLGAAHIAARMALASDDERVSAPANSPQTPTPEEDR